MLLYTEQKIKGLPLAISLGFESTANATVLLTLKIIDRPNFILQGKQNFAGYHFRKSNNLGQTVS